MPRNKNWRENEVEEEKKFFTLNDINKTIKPPEKLPLHRLELALYVMYISEM